ncbi:MAG: ATP-binding cassette domain-containing protein, partial [Methanomicrobiales archaeon]|nr:ATP-binding cassette domain-containing protein [Methanomicrobiales archaeon]
MAPLITVDRLGMNFDGKPTLRDISFQIGEGEIVGIIGRSGAGKTVLMHLIRGVEQPPTSGKVIYHVAVCDRCDNIEMPSFAGKLCRLCGGTLSLQHVDLWDEKNEAMKRRIMHRTSIMFQRTFALYGNDRVIENVLRALDDINYPEEKSINRAADLLDQVRLSHRMMHIARDLSGGEKQRVVLARQLAKEPFLLFADEPTGTLDPET